MMPVLMVCTGNICRSPMAAYLLRARLPNTTPWSIASAGTAAVDGLPASANAVAVLRERGIDLSTHRSRHCTQRQVARATLILAMAQSHFSALYHAFPLVREKMFLLGEFHAESPGIEIADPIGGSLDCYRHARDVIDACLDGIFPFLAQLRSGGEPRSER